MLALAAVLIASLGGGGGGQGRAPAVATTKESVKRPVKKKPSGSIAVSHAGWKPHPGPVPILMYHVIGEPKPGAALPDLYVSVDDFRSQVDWLDAHGYQAITQSQLEDGWRKRSPLPPKPIVLTFDDGYLGQFTDAMPILRRHDWPGVLNLKATGSDLNTGEVRKMIIAGWELASHTINHLDLTQLDPATLRHELADSRAQLRRRFHVAVENFCYPAGRYDASVVAAVKRAGYRGATTTDPGLASSRELLTLKRIRINRGIGIAGFVTALRSAGAAAGGVATGE
ncbi:MAG: hypothetical protein QOG09_1775 [Solirubrobacterales bacterium]|nr:hypothetical protein [Solirubrobacterales bacterium]